MPAKSRSVFSCSHCGAQTPKWVGQCPECQGWNTLVETAQQGHSPSRPGFAPSSELTRLSSVTTEKVARIPCRIDELDRVLGGGLVPGSVVLLGGDPGIGKSTLLLQALSRISARVNCIYVTGEESAQQIALRAQRLDLDLPELSLLADNSLEAVLDAVTRQSPRALVVDSIQTLYTEQLQSAPGSVAQVRECAAQLVRLAKQRDTIVILVGHVTKEGALAGPRVLEHMVDTVLYFEGERSSSLRLVRAVKNRFGAVNEVGVFAMTDQGLKAVSNPSALFLNRDSHASPGRVTLATREGTRPLLVEVQALVDRSPLANPRRLTVGLDGGRLAMLLAVLHRHGGYALYDQDVFVNVVGGVRVIEPAADLAILLSALSSFTERPIPADVLVFGEIGLAGEIRAVQGAAERLKEGERLGFRRALLPRQNPGRQAGGIELSQMGGVSDLVDWLTNLDE